MHGFFTSTIFSTQPQNVPISASSPENCVILTSGLSFGCKKGVSLLGRIYSVGHIFMFLCVCVCVYEALQHV